MLCSAGASTSPSELDLLKGRSRTGSSLGGSHAAPPSSFHREFPQPFSFAAAGAGAATRVARVNSGLSPGGGQLPTVNSGQEAPGANLLPADDGEDARL